MQSPELTCEDCLGRKVEDVRCLYRRVDAGITGYGWLAFLCGGERVLAMVPFPNWVDTNDGPPIEVFGLRAWSERSEPRVERWPGGPCEVWESVEELEFLRGHDLDTMTLFAADQRDLAGPSARPLQVDMAALLKVRGGDAALVVVDEDRSAVLRVYVGREARRMSRGFTSQRSLRRSSMKLVSSRAVGSGSNDR